MSKRDWEAMDRDELVKAAKTLELDYADLAISYDIVMDHNSKLENELYTRNADLQLNMLATESELQLERAEKERVQQHLLLNEKLSKLGEMVAGMTHELNNPLGVAMTAATFEKTCAQSLKRNLGQFAGQVLDEEALVLLNRDIEGLAESSDLLVSNLRLATEIIGSFKQMAVDQTSDRLREFNLGDVIRQTIASLKPQLRNKSYIIELNCDQSIPMSSYPGTIAQIITNLVMNSLNHGFAGRDWGTIRISSQLSAAPEAQVRLRYMDDGVGIAPEILPRIFDQFFTTKANAGGSGLGLSIVQNLVVQRLRGTIACSSTHSQGGQAGSTVFELSLPLQVKD